MRRKRKKWQFIDDDIVVEPEDGSWFEVQGGDLPGAIKIKSPVKKDVAEQFSSLVDKKSQTELKNLA